MGTKKQHVWIEAIIDVIDGWPKERQEEWNIKAHELLHQGHHWDKARISAYRLIVEKYLENKKTSFDAYGAAKNDYRYRHLEDKAMT